MNEVWIKLIEQAPFLAANILVVVIFVRYNERRDTEWRAMIEGMDKRHGEGTGRLAEEIKTLEGKMDIHDQYVREHWSRADAAATKGSLR